jgi:two-component system, NtrC family, sensor kinase
MAGLAIVGTALAAATGLGFLAWGAHRQLRDLRARRLEMEAEYRNLQAAQTRLVQAAKLATLGQLVAGLAHEMNTPIGALGSNHDTLMRALERLGAILEDEVVEESELEELRRVVRAIGGVMQVNELAVERLVSLVGSLRSFGRPDRSEVDVVDLHEGIESSLALLAHKIHEGIEVVRDYAEIPSVECLPLQLNQLFMNLLLNAVQAMEREGGRLTVRTARSAEEVVVEVSDTGPGIPPALRERIFEPGFTTKGARVGMGLGLLIAREIAERHAGTIEVGDTPGGGATFRVTLPVHPPLPLHPGTPGAGAALSPDRELQP